MNFIFEWQNSILRMSATIEARAATQMSCFPIQLAFTLPIFIDAIHKWLPIIILLSLCKLAYQASLSCVKLKRILALGRGLVG